MRISTLLAVFIFIASASSAQQKGNVFVGGTIGFYDYESDQFGVTFNQTDFSFNPSIGKFYAKNKLAGVNLSYYHSKFRDSLDRNTFGAGLFLRQFQPLGKSFFVFAEEGLNATSSKYNDYYGGPAEIKTRENSIYLNFYPGLAYSVNKKLWLEIGLPQLVSINYTKRKFKNQTLPEPNENNVSSFSINTGLSNGTLGNLSFGMRWLIEKK